MKIRAVPCTITAAKKVVLDWHRHNKPPQGALFAIGAEVGGELIGVIIVGRPVSRHYDNGHTCEVTRCCVVDGAQKGACSFLYQSAWRAAKAMGYSRMITYTLQSESGASLRGAGWKVIAERKGNNPKLWQSRQNRTFQSVVSEAKFLWERQ